MQGDLTTLESDELGQSGTTVAERDPRGFDFTSSTVVRVRSYGSAGVRPLRLRVRAHLADLVFRRCTCNADEDLVDLLVQHR